LEGLVMIRKPLINTPNTPPLLLNKNNNYPLPSTTKPPPKPTIKSYVMYWLVRAAPAHMLRLQSGRFDAPDRLFASIADSWRSASSGPTDVKELIPEFFAPGGGAWLENRRGLALGVKQSGAPVGDVKLPPWAEGPEDFVAKNRVRRGLFVLLVLFLLRGDVLSLLYALSILKRSHARTRTPNNARRKKTGRARGAARVGRAARLDRPHLWLQADGAGGGGRGQRFPPPHVRGRGGGRRGAQRIYVFSVVGLCE
jgi:hypothetical protein